MARISTALSTVPLRQAFSQGALQVSQPTAGKEILKTKPQQLSLQEMFLVAQTYEPGSPEFNEVFDIAVRLFPDNETANLNVACTDLQKGDLTSAEKHLAKAGNSKEAERVRDVFKQIKELE